MGLVVFGISISTSARYHKDNYVLILNPSDTASNSFPFTYSFLFPHIPPHSLSFTAIHCHPLPFTAIHPNSPTFTHSLNLTVMWKHYLISARHTGNARSVDMTSVSKPGWPTTPSSPRSRRHSGSGRPCRNERPARMVRDLPIVHFIAGFSVNYWWVAVLEILVYK